MILGYGMVDLVITGVGDNLGAGIAMVGIILGRGMLVGVGTQAGATVMVGMLAGAMAGTTGAGIMVITGTQIDMPTATADADLYFTTII